VQAIETWIRDGSSLLTPTAALALLGFVLTVTLLGALGAFVVGRRRGHSQAAFQALAAEALRLNNESFLTLASEKFRALQESSSVDLGGRHKAIEDLVAPLQEAIEGYRTDARELDRTRAVETGRLGQQLRELAHQTTELAGALRTPGARGRWGELSLRRTVELAGLSGYCDFSEQVSLGSGTSTVRPDLVVHLPSGREIAIDAKAPLDAYVDIFAVTSMPWPPGATPSDSSAPRSSWCSSCPTRASSPLRSSPSRAWWPMPSLGAW
jgi:hypothetical protein